VDKKTTPEAYFFLAGAIIRFFEKMDSADATRENFAIWMLLALSRTNARDSLLFRDFNLNQKEQYSEITVPDAIVKGAGLPRQRRIHTKAFGYMADVGGKRLIVVPASKRKGGRSKAHLAYEKMVRWSEDDGFCNAKVQRNQEAPASSIDHAIAKALQERADGETFSKGSGSPALIEEMGRLWLLTDIEGNQLAEEFSLDDIVACLPIPLRVSAENRAFNDEMLLPLAELLDSAGERYQSLRRCGLDPDQWFHEEMPTINQLRHLIKLGEKIKNDPGFHPDSYMGDAISAHWGENPVPKIALEEFLESAWGREFMDTFAGGKKRRPDEAFFDDEFYAMAQQIEETDDLDDVPKQSPKKVNSLIKALVKANWLNEAEARYLSLAVFDRATDSELLGDETILAHLDRDMDNAETNSQISRYYIQKEGLSAMKMLVRAKIREYNKFEKRG